MRYQIITLLTDINAQMCIHDKVTVQPIEELLCATDMSVPFTSRFCTRWDGCNYLPADTTLVINLYAVHFPREDSNLW